MRKYRVRLILLFFLFVALVVGLSVAAGGAARSAKSLPGEALMPALPSSVLRQAASVDRYTLPDGSPLVVHRLPLGPSNAFVLETDAGMLLVDAGPPFFGRAVADYMESLGRDDLKLIYITHAHIDHYGSAGEIRRLTGAPIAIHPDDAEQMAAGKTELGVVRGWDRLSALALPWVEPLLTIEETGADILVRDGDRLDAYGLPATVLHVPGHTPGSTALVVDGGVSFVGDLLSATGDPHVQSSYAYDWAALPGSLRHLAAYKPTLLYTGHGRDPINGADLGDLLRDHGGKFTD